MNPRTNRAEERMLWFLRRMQRAFVGTKDEGGFIVAWDADDVDRFLDAFPEALKTTRFYTMGHHVVPMLNRAALRARKLGYVRPGVIGNEEARNYNQRTWCRTWRMTALGVEFMKRVSR